jgi:hypothetical protein
MSGAAAGVMLGLSLGQAIGSIVSGVATAKSIKRQAEFNAKTYELNKRLADLQAEDALRRGERLTEQHRTGLKQITGQQRVSFAAQNIQLDEGSALEVMESTSRIGELEALTISNNAWKESFGYKISALNATTQAGAARIAGATQAQSAIMTGGLQAFQQGATGYYRYKTA